MWESEGAKTHIMQINDEEILLVKVNKIVIHEGKNPEHKEKEDNNYNLQKANRNTQSHIKNLMEGCESWSGKVRLGSLCSNIPPAPSNSHTFPYTPTIVNTKKKPNERKQRIMDCWCGCCRVCVCRGDVVGPDWM